MYSNRQAWLDYCLINPSGRPEKFYPDDRFGETIIKLCKEKVRPSSNAKSDEFLREVVAPNVLSLWKIKEVMARATQSTSHGNHHSLVGNSSDLCLLVKILVEDKVFELESGRGTKKTEFVDLFIRGSRIIAAGGPLEEYQRRARGNWKNSSAQDSELFADYEAEDSDDNIVDEGENLNESE